MVNRSIIEAWFAGAHADIGGGSRDDGLSLYPLQWMLLESRKVGLCLEHNPKRKSQNIIVSPLELVFLGPSMGSGTSSAKPWSFEYRNGIQVEMFDLRESHNHGNLQELSRRKLIKAPKGQPTPTHIIRINKGIGFVKTFPRTLFDEKYPGTGNLLGHIEKSTKCKNAESQLANDE
jgi:hypothetical protein